MLFRRAVCTILLLAGVCAAQGDARPQASFEEMEDAASTLLAALSAEQRQRMEYPLAGDERRNWYFTPVARKGLPLKEMTPAQRRLAYGLMASALSHRGFLQASAIMSLEQILADLENRPQVRDPELYFVTIFGTPGAREAWGWRVEGHHLSVNITVVGGERITATPSFFGANPAEVRHGSRLGLRVLEREEDLARALVRSLDPAQRQVAMIPGEVPPDIITGNQRRVTALEPVGLRAGKMNRQQQSMLRQLLALYLEKYREAVAATELGEIEKAGLAAVRFAWAGGMERGQPHYYRIQGPTFLMEYDNTQNNANHIHTVWRSFKDDFGEDLLRRHYEQHPHSPGQPQAK